MDFSNYFRASSYAMIACATLALVLAGGLHVALAGILAIVMVLAWMWEGTNWQLSERVGLVIVLLSVPLFILDWNYQKGVEEPVGRLGVAALAHLIVFLSAVKLLQVKKDRDWVFLYLISFFEVLLAAGLSFSPVFLGTLTLYLLCGLSTIISFEIQKSRRGLPPVETHLLVPPDSRIFKNAARSERKGSRVNVETGRLPAVAVLLFVLIFVLALPLFLVAPRSAGAALTRSGSALSNFTGFSENVTLGEIGSLKRDDAIVMHVRIEDPQRNLDLRWRGVALDEFTGLGWRKSKELKLGEVEVPRNPKNLEGPGLFQFGTTPTLNRLTKQTVFLEPIESPVLFAASRPIAIQGDFATVRVDPEGSVQARRNLLSRTMYSALSDLTQPDANQLRQDVRPYPAAYRRYLKLPEALDPRIGALTNAVMVNAHAGNSYDLAKAIETHLHQEYGYSLEMAAGGPDPLADFLFNVKAGHCEYFATAMAVMLRTRDIPARVVNGFLPGEYNEAAGAYTVRQSDAHSWVEVYFPETGSWVTFDPTPPAGREVPSRTGFTAQLGKYAEAFELIWFQYVIGYDKQEQRSLAASFQSELYSFGRSLGLFVSTLRQTISSKAGLVYLVGFGLAAAFVILSAVRRVRRFGWRRSLRVRPGREIPAGSPVAFYERLTGLLARRGLERDGGQTPLEFASDLQLEPALTITRAYNRVRFGGQQLSAAEVRQIEDTLRQLEGRAEARPAEARP
jgi:transglutaminase-like putative cysteine protease